MFCSSRGVKLFQGGNGLRHWVTTLFLQPAKKNQQIKILHPTKQWLIGVNYLPIVLEVAKAWPILASKDGLEASQVAEGSDPAFLQDPGKPAIRQECTDKDFRYGDTQLQVGLISLCNIMYKYPA